MRSIRRQELLGTAGLIAFLVALAPLTIGVAHDQGIVMLKVRIGCDLELDVIGSNVANG